MGFSVGCLEISWKVHPNYVQFGPAVDAVEVGFLFGWSLHGFILLWRFNWLRLRTIPWADWLSRGDRVPTLPSGRLEWAGIEFRGWPRFGARLLSEVSF